MRAENTNLVEYACRKMKNSFKEEKGMSNKFCEKCGTAIAEGQQFCSGCGAPQTTTQSNVCTNCGATLGEGQEFCASCGQKVGTSSMIDQFNAGIEQQQKKKSGLKKLLMFGIPALVILIVVLLKLGGGFEEGTYNNVTTGSEETYTFEDGSYTYKTEDDTETGSYEVDGKEATITVEDGDDIVFVQHGEYIYKKESHYEQKIPDGDTFNQTVSVENSITLKGSTYDLKAVWEFSKDGTYTWETTLGLGSYTSTMSEAEGTYERDGDLLILSPNGEDNSKTYLVIDGLMYYSVYKKQ